MKLDTDRARELGRIGGRASARAKKARRGMRETLLDLLSRDACDTLAEPTSETTAGEVIARTLIRQAAEGNIKACEFIRDTTGEKPGTKSAPDTAPDQTREIRIRVVE